MCKNNQKFKVNGKVQSISVDNDKIIVKFRPNYEDGQLLLEIEGGNGMMKKCKADEPEFYIKNCRIANIITMHSREQMTFSVEMEGSKYHIIGVELIYG